MNGKKKFLMGLGLLAIGLVALMALGSNPGPGKVTGIYPAKLWINDFSGTALSSDGVNDGWYIDHRLVDSPVTDLCVTAKVGPGALFFIWMNYNAEEGGFDCSTENQINPRTYTIGPLIGSVYYTGPENFRIRSENLFGGKGTTPVAFMFYDSGISYEVRPDTEVPITGTGDVRTLKYAGTATLWRITKLFKTEKTPVPLWSFHFPFEITVVRVRQ